MKFPTKYFILCAVSSTYNQIGCTCLYLRYSQEKCLLKFQGNVREIDALLTLNSWNWFYTFTKWKYEVVNARVWWLAIYCKDKQIWSAKSFGNDIDGLYFYDDGNLAVVRNDRSFVWSTDTHVTPNKPTVLTILDEGNLILSTTSGQVVGDTISYGKGPTGKP